MKGVGWGAATERSKSVYGFTSVANRIRLIISVVGVTVTRLAASVVLRKYEEVEIK